MKTKKVEVVDHAKEQAKMQLMSIQGMVSTLNKIRIAESQGKDDYSQLEQAEQAIHEDALSVEVRSGWYTLDQDSDRKPQEYTILLCTGGPACRVIGQLSEHGEPETARIEYQDWGTPWIDYRLTAEEEKDVLTYASCFYFGE